VLHTQPKIITLYLIAYSTIQYQLSRRYITNSSWNKIVNYIQKCRPHWWLHLIVVRKFEYASDPESYTSGSVATGRASLAGQVKDSLYQQIGLKFEEETSKMLHLEHGFVWC
jgi:hypothetical protein